MTEERKISEDFDTAEEIARVCEQYEIGVSKDIKKIEAINKLPIFLDRLIKFIKSDKQKDVLIVDGIGVEVRKEGERKAKENIISHNELINKEFPQEEWIIQDLIPAGSIGFLAGKRDSYKSFFAQYLALCIASGKSFIGYKTIKTSVLYLSLENADRLMSSRGKIVTKGSEVQENSLYYNFNLKLDRDGDFLEIESYIQKYNIGLIIVDSFRRSGSFREKDNDDINDFYIDRIKPLAEKHGISIIFIAHVIKGKNRNYDALDNIRGAGDIGAIADFCLDLQAKTKSTLILSQTKIRNTKKKPPIRISIETDEKTYFKLRNEGFAQEVNQGNKAKQVLLKWFSKQKKGFEFRTAEANAILDKEEIIRDFFYEARDSLIKEEIIAQKKKGRYKLIGEIDEQFKL